MPALPRQNPTKDKSVDDEARRQLPVVPGPSAARPACAASQGGLRAQTRAAPAQGFRLNCCPSYSAACRYLRANSRRASSAHGSMGVKLRWAMNSGRLNLVMWLETAHSVRYTILRG